MNTQDWSPICSVLVNILIPDILYLFAYLKQFSQQPYIINFKTKD